MNKNLITVIVLVAAAFVAIYLGLIAASGDFVTISAWGGVVLFLLYLLKGQNHSIEIYLFLIWGGISFYWGFSVLSLHIVAALFTMHIASSALFRRHPLRPSGLLRDSGQGLVTVIGGLFLIYGVIHLLFLRASPQIIGEFSMKNSAKSYFLAFAPILILLAVLGTNIRFKVGDKWVTKFFYWLFFAILINGGYLAYLYYSGFSSRDASFGDDEISRIYIPLINAAPHHFAFRQLGPIAVLFSAAFLTEKSWIRSQSFYMKSILVMCLLGGLAGTVGSGGRGGLILCFLFILFVTVYRKSVILMFLGGTAVLLMIVLANTFSGFINDKAPTFIARPLQYVMWDRGDSMVTIESSDNQRTALFKAALEEWQSDPRIFTIGRGVYPHRYGFDELRPSLGEEGAFVEVNLRAGTCHALLPSCLVQYGILGTLLYMTFLLVILKFSWDIYKKSKMRGYSSATQTAAFCVFIFYLVKLPLEIFAGGWLDLFFVTMLILLRTRSAEEEEAYEASLAEDPPLQVTGSAG